MTSPYIYQDYAYLDFSKLNEFAAQNDIETSVDTDVVERKKSDKKGEGGFNAQAVKISGGGSSETEVQKTYRLSPSERSNATKILSELIKNGQVLQNEDFQDGENSSLEKGRLIELRGFALPTEASVIGEIMNHLSPLIADADSLEELLASGADQGMATAIGMKAFTTTELPNIHLLYHLDPSDVPGGNIMNTYINFAPGFFINKENPVDLDQEITIFGHVKILVAGDKFKGTDVWVMPGFNRMLRSELLAGLDLKELSSKFSELHQERYEMQDPSFVQGPAMIIDVAAMY